MSQTAKIFTVIMTVLLLFILVTGANLADSGLTRLRARARGVEKHWRLRPGIGGKTRIAFSPKANVIPKLVLGKEDLTPQISPEPQVTNPPQLPPQPQEVKGIYLTSWMTGNSEFLKKIIAFSAHTEINSVVIDVKDDTGLLSFPCDIPLAREIGAGIRKYDPAKVLALLKQNHIFTIARIVVFKDPLLAKKRSDLAVQSSQGGLWRDKLGMFWVDPHNQKVWDYNVGIAKVAAQLGFDEVQFDYVRFTSDGPIQYCRYPGADGRPKADIIGDFLKFAYRELHPLGVKVSADLFGLTCSARDDLGIGQILEKVVPHVDIICPMVYPSHYPKGVYQISDPEASPYKTVFQSLNFAKKRLDVLTDGRQVIMRPWLQDFSLRQVYNREQLLAQIKAVQDAGFREYIFWNPSNKYEERKYRTKEEILREIKTTPAPTPLFVSPLPSPSPLQLQPPPQSPVPSGPESTAGPSNPAATVTPKVN